MKKAIKSILIALALIAPSLAVDQDPVVEQYSDEMPKSQLVLTVARPNKKIWENPTQDEGYNQDLRLHKTTKFILEFLKERRIYTSGYESLNYRNSVDYFFGNFYSGELKDYLIYLNIQNHFDRDFPLLRQEQLYTKNKEKEVFTQGSWKWVSRSLSNSFDFMNRVPKSTHSLVSTILRERISSSLQKKGLQKSLIRLSVVVNQKNLYSFFILWNTEEEKKEGEAFVSCFFKDIKLI